MALKDLKSNLSWYGTIPPQVNAFTNTDSEGFVTKKPGAAGPSDFKGVSGTPGAMAYKHTGNRGLGELGIVQLSKTHITNEAGYRINIMPVGTGRPDSSFSGIMGDIGSLTYDSPSLLGQLNENYKPISNADGTLFSDDGPSPMANIRGYDNNGAVLSPRTVAAANKFRIDGGNASREAQLGPGTKFPVSYDGTVHQFDKVRTGFGPDAKYGDSYGVLSGKAGLADTYAKKSPIDDMYNKFNLREDSPNGSYAKQPFILRGIQREGETKNQRWGAGETTVGQIFAEFGLPRAGIVTAAERAAVDIARLGKLFISPKGLSYIVRQVGMQLTNPNTEQQSGFPRKAFGQNSPKLFTPVNTLLQPLAGIVGSHLRRSGLTPVDDLFGGSDRTPHNYEDVHKQRAGSNMSTDANRLVLLKQELIEGTKATGYKGSAGKLMDDAKGEIGSGHVINTLSNITGPASVLGIGFTKLRRYESTLLRVQFGDDATPLPGRWETYAQYNDRYYTYDRQYAKNPVWSNNATGGWDEEKEMFGEDSSRKNLNVFEHKGLKGIMEVDIDRYGTSEELKNTGILKDNNRTGQDEVLGGGRAIDSPAGRSYHQLSYGQIPKRGPGEKVDLDFRSLKHLDLDSDGKPPEDALYANNQGSQGDGNNHREILYNYRKYNDGDRGTGLPDPIQSIDFVEGDGKNSDYPSLFGETLQDFIKFKFAPMTGTSVASANDFIIFRAYLDTLSDSFMPEWTPANDQGRADPKIQYAGFDRNINIGFRVPIMSRLEIQPVWNKLNGLASLTYPRYLNSGFTGIYTKVTIGDLYVDQPMYVQSLDLDWDNETPWELQDGFQVPFYTTVNMALGWVGQRKPEYNVTQPFDGGWTPGRNTVNVKQQDGFQPVWELS